MKRERERPRPRQHAAPHKLQQIFHPADGNARINGRIFLLQSYPSRPRNVILRLAIDRRAVDAAQNPSMLLWFSVELLAPGS